MPGNEVGDRIHNFFGQENLSQGQHHLQVVDETWPGLNNNLWLGSQRQIGAPLASSNLKSYSVQPSADSERGHGGQSSSVQHVMNITQSALKSELLRSRPVNQQPNLNGYMHEYQALQTRQNESNFLGVDPEYNRHNLTSRSLPVLDSQLGNVPELNKNNSLPSESAESPVNYDFFGTQQPMSGQHSSILQPRQQSDNSDMQPLHQQVMLKRLQELQRQQQLQNSQFQHQEAMQQSYLNQVSSVAKQAAGGHAPGHINGIPMQDGSNYAWQPDLMAGNTNWLQRGASPVMQGSSTGHMFSPDQGPVHMMGFIPHQVDQSLHGIPVSNTRINPSQYSPIQMDKPTMPLLSSSSNTFPGNQCTTFPDHFGMQDRTMGSRQSYQGKNIFSSSAGQGLSSLENLQQMNAQQRSVPMQEFHERQGLVGPSEPSHEKTGMLVSPLQNAATLDPEEEKILFGSDDNLWAAFGRSTIGSGCSNTLDSTDFSGAVPSLQSGSWSALMQSAVAETSSSDMVVQEGWSGLGVRSNESLASTQQPTYDYDGSKQSSAWSDSNLQIASTMNPLTFPSSGDANTSDNHSSALGIQQPGLKPSHEPSEALQNGSSRRLLQQFSGEGSKWLDNRPLGRPVSEGSHFYGSVAHSSDSEPHAKVISVSWIHQEGVPSLNTSGHSYNRPSGWKVSESVSPGGGLSLKDQIKETSLQHTGSGEHKNSMHEQKGHFAGISMSDSVSRATEHGRQQVNREDSDLTNDAATISDSCAMRTKQKRGHQYPNSHNLNLWKNVDSSVNSRDNEIPGKYLQHQDKSPQNIVHDGHDKGGVEHEMDNSNTKEKSSASYRSNMSHHTSTAFQENICLDASNSRTLPGGKQKSSGHAGRKPSGTRKFQYHPMGDVDVDTGPSYGIKNVAHSQAMPQQVSQGLTGHDHVHLGQSKYFGQRGKNSMGNEKGRLPGFQGGMKYMDEMPSKITHPECAPHASAPFDNFVGNYSPSRTAPSSQNMLELLHKVDQSKENSHATNVGSSGRNQSQIPEAETSDGSVDHLQQNQSSASQGFGLQLGPPSEKLSIADNAISSQGSQASLSSLHVTSDMGKKSHTWLASTTTVQTLHPSRETSLGDARNNICSTSGQISKKASQHNIQGNFSGGFQYPRSHQQMSDTGGQVTPSQSVKQFGDSSSSERTETSQAALALVPNMSKGTLRDKFTSTGETSQLSSNIQNHGGSAQMFPVLEAMPVPQSSVIPGMSQQVAITMMSRDARATFSNHQSSVSKVLPNLFNARLQSADNSEKNFSGPEKQADQIAQKRDNGPCGFAAYSAKPQGFVQENQSAKEKQESLENDAGQRMMNASYFHGKESVANCLADSPHSNSSATQRDIEAFGRSLKPNNMLHESHSLLHQMQAIRSTDADPDNMSMERFKGPEAGLDASQVQNLHENYSLLNQMQSMKRTDSDPNNRSMKRFKGPESALDASQVQNLHEKYTLLHQLQAVKGTDTDPDNRSMKRFKGPESGLDASQVAPTGLQQLPTNYNPPPPGDSKMLSFSSKLGDNCGANASPHDMSTLSHNDSQSSTNVNNAYAVRTEPSQVSPQMAPSCFDQYGTFKSGLMSSVYDAQKITALKTLEQPSIVAKPSDNSHVGHLPQANTVVDARQLGNIPQSSIPMSVASEHLSSPQLLPPIAADQDTLHMRQKKQNVSITKLPPWHREVMQGFSRLQNISMAEAEWAQATNRLMEKVEEETDLEDGPPRLRSKRRLILTTQLMQQLLCPPQTKVLSSDSSSHYGSVTYVVARSALGDACSSISSSRSETCVDDSGSLLSGKLNASERIGDQYISKVIEDFTDRAKKLEDNISRLDKRASILDMRVECQDLEKFSVINRFAKFHGRVQAEGAEASSSSDANAQKFFPLRYVTALSIPRNLPDRVQCLSL